MKNRIGKKLLGAMVAISLGVIPFYSADASGRKSGSSAAKSESQQRAKARYYFLEGLRHQVEGRHAEAYENFK